MDLGKAIDDAGIDRARKRQSNGQATRRGRLSRLASPAGNGEGRGFRVPPAGTRSRMRLFRIPSFLRGLAFGVLPVLAVMLTGTVLANPEGGSVAAGSAVISGEGTSRVTVTQSSSRAVIDWNKFSIGASETTRFIQPNSASITANRVVGVSPSRILGRLEANGRVVLINRNGILFGRDARVDAAGLIATVHDLPTASFMEDSSPRFDIPGDRARVGGQCGLDDHARCRSRGAGGAEGAQRRRDPGGQGRSRGRGRLFGRPERGRSAEFRAGRRAGRRCRATGRWSRSAGGSRPMGARCC